MGPFSGQGPWGASGSPDWLGWLPTILVAGSVYVAIVLLVMVLRIAGRHNPALFSSGGNRALDVLQERYAWGEIDRTEFEEKRRDLA
ncbi:MAG: SHOCT domain-containing protein [candidate division NC10 bacterium]|nr:SHOCT domain-containing protein [candidate division NC10 bacterium]